MSEAAGAMSEATGAAPVRCVVALGSNIEPARYLPQAVRELARLGTVLRVSSVWQSAPVGFTAQADFCNGAVLLETRLAPRPLKAELRRIEDGLGRVRDPANKNAPRTIDLDIAVYGDLVCQEEGLTLPDPDLFRRDFLAFPAAEVAPDLPCPGTPETLATIAARFPDARETLRVRADIPLSF